MTRLPLRSFKSRIMFSLGILFLLPLSGLSGAAGTPVSPAQKATKRKPVAAQKPIRDKPAVENPKPAPAVELATTGKTADFLTSFEREIFAEINLARKDPRAYAGFLVEYKKQYNGKNLLLPNRKPLITFEGTRAADEALEFLQKATPLPQFDLSQGISLAARERLVDMSKTGTQGHRGSDGSLPNDRLDKYGSWSKSIGEAISYNVGTAREVVLGFIVDDGTSNRGHRKNIFSPDYTVVGIASGDSLKPSSNCVVDFAGGFLEKGQQNPKKSAKNEKSTAAR